MNTNDCCDCQNGSAWRAKGSRMVRPWRKVSFIAVLAAAVVGISACGGGSAPTGVASVGSSSTTTTTASVGSASNAALSYAECMRAHGVSNFPDPSATGGFQLGPGIDPTSPTFRAAQTTCQKLVGGGLPGAGSTTHPSAHALAQMLKVSRCMRRHGISDFPDPLTSMPSSMAGVQYLSDRDGVILVFPRGFDDQSPEFTRAAAACGFKLTNH